MDALVMRSWKTPEDTLIVECPPLAGVVNFGPIYREVDLAGTVLRSYKPYGYSAQEYSGEYHYAVEGDALVERRTEERDRGDPRVSGRVLKVGLTPADEIPFPFLSTICAAAVEVDRARDEAAWAESRRREALRLRSPSELPNLEGEEPLDLVLTEQGEEAVVILDDRVLWREPRLDWSRDRSDEIRAIFQAKYGPRLRSFKSHFWVD